VTEKVHREAGRHYGPLAVTAEKLYERFTDEELEVVLRFLLAGAELFGPLLDELRARLDRGG
jgi:hypothetical protein